MYILYFIILTVFIVSLSAIISLFFSFFTKNPSKNDKKRLAIIVGFCLLFFLPRLISIPLPFQLLFYLLIALFILKEVVGIIIKKSLWEKTYFWVVLFILFLIMSPHIYDVIDEMKTPWDDYRVSDTQIQSELSKIRSSAEQYYHENDESYTGYKDSSEWSRMKNEIPDCSVKILQKESSSDYNNFDEYQINITNDGQSYVIWAPYCYATAKKNEEDYPYFSIDNYLKILSSKEKKDDVVYYCMDSQDNAKEYETDPADLEAKNCNKLFGK